MKTFGKLIVLVALILCVNAAAFASYGDDEIVIMDVSGIVRNVTRVEKPATIEFTVTDQAGMPADGAQITLRSESGAEFSKVSVQGIAVFEEVTPGMWTVSSASPEITFTGILFSDVAADTAFAAAAGGSAAVAAAAFESGGAAAAGGAAVTGGAMVSGGAIVTGGIALTSGALAISYTAREEKDRDLSPHR